MPYCVHCGAYLEEGQRCTCAGALAEQESAAPADPEFIPLEQSAGAPEAPDSHPQQPAPSPAPDAGPQPDQQAPQPEPDSPSAPEPDAPSPDPGPASQPGGHTSGPTWTTQSGTTQSGPGPSAQPPRPSPVSIALKNLRPFLKAYWRSPAQATRSAVEQQDWAMALVLSVIQCLAAILAVLSVLIRLNRAIASLFGYLGSLMSYVGMGGGYSPAVSPALCIPTGLLGAALGIVLMTAMLLGLTLLMKSKTTFPTAFIACGVNTIPVTAVLLLAFLLGLFSIGLGLGLLVMVLPVFAASGLISARQLCPETDSGKFWLCYLAGVILVAAITWFLLSAVMF